MGKQFGLLFFILFSVTNLFSQVNPTCKGAITLHGHDNIIPSQTNYKKYFPATGFTWETWINGSYYDNSNTTINTRLKLIAATDFPAAAQDIVLGFGWPQVAQKRELCFVVDGPNGIADRDNTPCTYFPSGGFLPNTWYHVAAVRDYANNTSKLYVNGVLVDSKMNIHQPLNPSSNIIFPNFYFGSMTGIGATDSAFAGKMDEIRIWNYPRTASDIQSSYNQCLTGNETGLVAYYRCNDKNGITLHDATTNANNATVSTANDWDKTINAPIVSPCLLATFSTKDSTICQGDSLWGHHITGNYVDTFINALGCDSLRKLNLIVVSCNVVVASFIAPDTVCVNAPVNIVNTSTGATTFNWNFCNNASNAIVAGGSNLGNIGGNFSVPVFMDYVADNGNYYGFVTNWQNSSLVRLDFGSSLLNTPTSTIINTASQLPSPNGAEDIKLIKHNSKWYGFIVGGSPTVSSNPSVIIKLEFGTSITNTNPIVTNWGNIGTMEQPHQLYTWQENNNWYGIVFNAVTSTFTRFDFTNSFNNTPTGVNLGNIGSLVYPSNFDVVNDNGIWRIFVTNAKNNTISRLDFGSSLLNTPTGINLGGLGGVLSFPRGIRIENSCNEVFGYICNQTGNDITKMNFNNNLSSVPTAVSLGNIGSLNNPISFSKYFIAGSDKYMFVPNANSSNTISLLKLQGCTNSSIPNSTTAKPPAVSYNTAGTYNINLSIDEGLPTQSSFCKRVVVVGIKSASINHTICQGSTFWGHSSSFDTTFHLLNSCDSLLHVNITTLPTPSIIKDTLQSCGSYTLNGTTFTRDTIVFGNSIKNMQGCDSIIKQTNIIITTLLKKSIDTTICQGDSLWGYNIAGNYIDSFKSILGCDSLRFLKLHLKELFSIKLPNDTSICQNDSIVINLPNNYFYQWNNGSTSNYLVIKDTGFYKVQAHDATRCNASDSFHLISLYPDKKHFLPNQYPVCSGEQFTLPDYVSYYWMTGETTATIVLHDYPSYWVQVTNKDGCVASDTMKIIYLGSDKFTFVNAFSPNNDGVNDFFKPLEVACVSEFEMVIFDRWGQQVYQTHNIYGIGWDGKFNENPVPVGVYYYIINYKNTFGEAKKQSGSVALLR